MSRYVVLDLEMCNVPKFKKKEYRYATEIIEIGAVLLDEELEVTDSFKTYVCPQYGRIDSIIQDLTGITTKETAYAPFIEEALTMFLEWLPDDVVLVAWSGSDAYQLRAETHAKRISLPRLNEILETSLDCQITFGEKMHSKRSYGLTEALVIANVQYEDGAHDALVDARNTAMLFAKMLREDELELNPYYTDEIEEPANCPFAELLAGYKCVG